MPVVLAAEARPAVSAFTPHADQGFEGGVPVGGVPDGGVPVGGVPDGGVPVGGVPEGGVPDGGFPGGGVPEGGPLLVEPIWLEEILPPVC